MSDQPAIPDHNRLSFQSQRDLPCLPFVLVIYPKKEVVREVRGPLPPKNELLGKDRKFTRDSLGFLFVVTV